MPSNKQAALFEVNTPFQVVESDLPSIGPNDALVNFTHSGCCYTEEADPAVMSMLVSVHAHALGEFGGHVRTPGMDKLVGGHEGVGVIVKLGDEVKSHSLKVGSRVGMGFLNTTCQTCEMCTTGQEEYCPKQQPTGFKVDGTFQQYAVYDAEYLIPIPDSLDSAATVPLLCAGATVYSGLKAAEILPGQWVAIPGAGGGLGHIAVQFAKAMGAKVIGIDAGEKEGVVMQCGADHFVNFQTEKDVPAAVKALTDGGAHVIIVTGVPAYSTAWYYARLRGTVICLAMGATTFDASLAVVLGLKVLGSSTASRKDTQEALELAAKHNVQAIIELRGMDDIERTIGELKKGLIKGRVVIDLSK